MEKLFGIPVDGLLTGLLAGARRGRRDRRRARRTQPDPRQARLSQRTPPSRPQHADRRRAHARDDDRRRRAHDRRHDEPLDPRRGGAGSGRDRRDRIAEGATDDIAGELGDSTGRSYLDAAIVADVDQALAGTEPRRRRGAGRSSTTSRRRRRPAARPSRGCASSGATPNAWTASRRSCRSGAGRPSCPTCRRARSS